MSILTKYYKAYSNLNIIIFVVFNVALLISLGIAIRYLPFTETLINPYANNLSEKKTLGYTFFMLIILLPLIETLVFQAMVIRIILFFFKKLKKTKIIIAIMASSILFAINHPYSISYILTAFFMGFVLAVSYIAIIKRKYSSIIVTFVIHSFYNMIPFISSVINYE